jgi:hypothetical protein
VDGVSALRGASNAYERPGSRGCPEESEVLTLVRVPEGWWSGGKVDEGSARSRLRGYSE